MITEQMIDAAVAAMCELSGAPFRDEELKAALEAAEAVRPKPEPVAWRYKGDSYFDGNNWYRNWEFTGHEALAKFKAVGEYEPLYAEPPAQAGYNEHIEDRILEQSNKCATCVPGPAEQVLTFQDAVKIAQGCLDYGGGYRSDAALFEIYQHGIMTVIYALEGATKRGLDDTQIAVLHSIGAAAEQQGEKK